MIENPERISLLKRSLSQTLGEFYPHAGRVRENMFVECNDEGVDFIRTTVNCQLSDVLRQPEVKLLDKLLSHDAHASMPPPTDVHFAFQVNVFSCGGIAIGISSLHKLVDGPTLSSFMNTWASIARGSSKYSPPIFVGPHLVPPRDLSGLLPSLDIPQQQEQLKVITKRLVFDSSKISAPREKMSARVGRPGKTQIVSGLIWRSAMNASRLASSGSMRQSFLFHAVDLRPMLDPPIPVSAAGVLCWLVMAQAPSAAARNEAEVHDLVNQLKIATEKFDEDGLPKLEGTARQLGELTSKGVDIYRCTSLKAQQFYGADFGWGKPVWVSSAGFPFKNSVILIETRDGDGIEAWVTLDARGMAIFEHDQELLPTSF